MKKYIISVASLMLAMNLFAAGRSETLLRKGWKFTREDSPEFAMPDYKDGAWKSITVHHDWAIYGPFSWDNDRQNVAIAQDGQKEAMEHAGRTGGLPFVGTGWYRTEVDVPRIDKGERVTLMFDGAMSHAKVYVNGKEAGYWPYGYNSFYFDITDLVKSGEKNSIAVRLENLPESSRWYPGAGLYRNVRLIVTEDAHIPVWGTYITTPDFNKDWAKVVVRTKINLPEGANEKDYTLSTVIKDRAGKTVGEINSVVSDLNTNHGEMVQTFIVENPELWSPDAPNLYTADSRLLHGKEVKDETPTTFGIRSIDVRPNEGFFLNGEKIVFKGVCN
ncbi:MAG: beta-galactosidase, partial [Paramuribaculum sp.]|nr:beta-galactosidase [Paramuribaculum sp.]